MKNLTTSRTLPLICLALLAITVLQAFARSRVVSIDKRSPEPQATPTPFPCQPLPSTCPSAPVVTVNSPQVPCDVCPPSGFGGNPIAFFDDYSWRSFIALVWPALNGQRGVPDPNQTVGGSGPLVFETYKGLWEVFHTDGSAPAGWNDFDPPAMNACGVQTAFGDLVLASFSKFSDLGQAGFGSLVGPLVAQNQTYVSYLTAYNQLKFDQITNPSNQW